MATMPVELGKVREYARATANDRPEYLDDPHPPIPPTFLSTVVFWEPLADVLQTPAVVDACRAAGIEPDVRQLLSLEQEYVFPGPLPRAGDTLSTSTRFDGVEVKAGSKGPMILVHFAVEFRGERDELRAECLYTSGFVTTEASE
jgi:hypothetical protein